IMPAFHTLAVVESLEQRMFCDGSGSPAVPADVGTPPATLSVFASAQPQEPVSFDSMVVASLESDPEAAARQLAPALAARSPGGRVVFLWAAMDASFHDLNLQNPSSFIASGLDTDSERQWCVTFFSTLKAMSVQVDRVVTDNELGFS